MDEKVRTRDRETWLITLAEALGRDPGNLSLLFERAVTLDELGRDSEAEGAYQALLIADPNHFWGLMRFSALLYRQNRIADAFKIAIDCLGRHPTDANAHTAVADILYKTGALAIARGYYESALALSPLDRAANAGLAQVLSNAGEHDAARTHRRIGESKMPITVQQFRGTGQGPIVLLLVSEQEDRMSIHFERLIDESKFHVSKLVADYADIFTMLPDPALIINGVGDAEISSLALKGAERLHKRINAPIINAPAAIRGTSRVAIAERLSRLSNVRTPRTALIERSILEQPDGIEQLRERGFHFPLLIRTPGFQAGRLFTRIETPEAFKDDLAGIPGAEVLVIEYIDYAADDGMYHKYRVMTINGRLYPLHLAIAQTWKVHYFNADTIINPDLRALEEAFLHNFEGHLGSSAIESLQAISAEIDLDYGGIDFTLEKNGNVLVFEANASMAVAMPGKESRWNYRRPAVHAIQQAAEQMFLQRIHDKQHQTL